MVGVRDETRASWADCNDSEVEKIGLDMAQDLRAYNNSGGYMYRGTARVMALHRLAQQQLISSWFVSNDTRHTEIRHSEG